MDEKTPICFQTGPGDETFGISFACLVSPQLGSAIKFYEENYPERGAMKIIRQQVEGLVRYFEQSTELCSSLKAFCPHGKLARQVDLRMGEGGSILFRCFMHWSFEEKRWHCCLEGADENFWEQRQINQIIN
jgi:hypothetical protein